MDEIENIIRQLENQRTSIDRALEALRGLTGIGAPVTTKKRGRPPGKKQGGGMSAEARARIGEATRQRWAAKRAAEIQGARKASKLAAKKAASKAYRKNAGRRFGRLPGDGGTDTY